MPEQKKSNAPLLILLFLVAGVFLLYARVRHHEFMCYDDGLYVTENAYVQQGLSHVGIKWAFVNVAGIGTYWHPVTWLSHMLDWQLFKDNAGKHHMVNVLFHAINVALLFYLLRRLTKSVWPSAVVAALFAFHPLQVDTVAWVAERKNVLSTLFWLLTTFAYVRYTELLPKRGWKPVAAYATTFVLFAIGLMCKPMLVTLPCTLLLIDVWPLKRMQKPTPSTSSLAMQFKLLVEKIPLFALSAISCLITIKAHEKLGMIQTGQTFPMSARIANSMVGYATYLRKVFWPTDLAVFYPLPETWPQSIVLLSIIIVIAITVVAFFLRRKAPGVLFGWLWFLGTLVPVIGILQVHDQAMADRFVYVPLIGIFIAVAWGLYALPQTKTVLGTAATLGIALCFFASWQQVGYWKDCQTLMTHAAQVTKNNYIAYNNLGADHAKYRRMDEALENYSLAVQSKNNYPMAHSNLGVIYAQRGDLDRAMQEFQTALQFDPDYADALCNAGRIYMLQKRTDLAIEHFRHAIKMRPNHIDAHTNLGQALSSQGKNDDALAEFETASRIPPARPDSFSNLGAALAKAGRFDEAVRALNQALTVDPTYANAENNLGYVFELQQRFEEAAAHYEAALRLDPNHGDAKRNLQRLLNRAQAATSLLKK